MRQDSELAVAGIHAGLWSIGNAGSADILNGIFLPEALQLCYCSSSAGLPAL
jgi:hypothetical protein